MQADDEQRIEELFHEAADLPVAERTGFLKRRCPDRPDLRDRVERLLGFREPDRDVLAAPALSVDADHGAPADDRPLPGQYVPGTIVGDRFKLIEVIGEGGLGQVWRAEQFRPMRREVALKLVKLGMDSVEVLTRFETERNALALMDHPGIARVFDAGITDSGRPYFVMEYVRGAYISDFCDAERMSTHERLRLFLDVCAAVQHAHQKGIIHRDLKPSNILVTRQDGRPRTKVIDFGIAKATARKLTERTAFTEFGQLMGTPEYMSPEQAEPTRADVDSRSDIFSLGVVLYQLLIGMLPFDSQSLRRRGLAAMHEIIRDEDPPKPSTRFNTLDDTTTGLVKLRRTDVRTLQRELRGDLDWITMKAMEKECDDRYASASEFAADIERHLRHEAVLAGPRSAGYRMSKLMRRNRAGVIFAATIALILIGGVIGTSWGMVSARRQRDDARDARNDAIVAKELADDRLAATNTARMTLQDTLDFLLSGFGFALDETGSDEMTVRQMLDLAEAEVDERYDAETRLNIRSALGRFYFAMGAYEPAMTQLEGAYRLHHRLGRQTDIGHIWVLTTLNMAARNAGRPEAESQRWMQEGVIVSIEFLREEYPELGRATAELTKLVKPNPPPPEAVDAMLKAIALAHAEAMSPDHLDGVAVVIVLAGVVAHLIEVPVASTDIAQWGRGNDLGLTDLALSIARPAVGSQSIDLLILMYMKARLTAPPGEEPARVALARELIRFVSRKYQDRDTWLRAEFNGVLGSALAQAALLEDQAEATSLLVSSYRRIRESPRATDRSVLVAAKRLIGGSADSALPTLESLRFLQDETIYDALREAIEREQHPGLLNWVSGAIVSRSGLAEEQYDIGVDAARRAAELAPAEWVVFKTLGAGLFRVGRYEEALETLARAEELREGVPSNWAFIAMSRHELGRHEATREAMERLAELMADPRHGAEPESVAISREAAALIGGTEFKLPDGSGGIP